MKSCFPLVLSVFWGKMRVLSLISCTTCRCCCRTLLEDDGVGDGTLLPARRDVPPRYVAVGGRGIREPKGRVKGYRVEVRPSGWSRKIWVGTFHQLQQAMRAYDATLHYTGKIPYYFIHPEGCFRPCPPGLENVPQTKEFVSFVKRMAKEFAKTTVDLDLNPQLSEVIGAAEDFSGIRVVLAGDQGEAGSTLSATATPPIPSAARALSKRSSTDFGCKPEVICLSSSTESESISGKGAEEIEVVSPASPPPPLLLTMDDRSFKMDSPTAEDIANLLFPAAAEASGLDELDVLFCPNEASPNFTKRTRVAGFRIESAGDLFAMPGAENPNCITASFQTVLHGSKNRNSL